jgi:transcription termination/antitermination protein NusG
MTTGPGNEKWHVLWTRSQCEQAVHDQLAGKGFHLFLPMTEGWFRQHGIRHRLRRPMLPGYLFLHRAMDQQSYLTATETRGVLRVLGQGWDRLAEVPGAEIAGLRRLEASGLPAGPHPYLCAGQRVRITEGPLAGLDGIFVRRHPGKGMFVVSIDLLQRSVAVEIQADLVEAA